MMTTMKNPKATVLIVDDNQDSRELLVKLLTISGYETVEAVDGEDALNKATSQRPDLILMDQSLPKMNGYEVTKKLKQIKGFRTVPIVALTAHAMRGEKEKALKAGCDGYIAKPINVRTLPGVIDRYLKNRWEENASGETQ
jgi:two-component system cell cycle response regulator DivK